jgi:hypothetical protein
MTPDEDNPKEGASTPLPGQYQEIKGQTFIAEKIGSWTCLGSSSEIVIPADSEVPDFKTTETPRSRRGWQYPLKPIKFDSEVGKFLWNKVKYLASRERWEELAYNDLLTINEPYRSNLHGFLVNLFSYTLAVPENRRDLSIYTILRRSLQEGPAFADYVSDLKSYLFAMKHGRRLFSQEIKNRFENDEIPFVFTCVGDIYRSNSLFYWTPENPDIVGITSEEPFESPEIISEFRDKTRQYLENPKFCFFKANNDYKTFYTDNTKKAKEGMNWQLDPVKPASIRGVSKVAFIPRELSGSRAAVVEDSDSVLRIRWIDSEVKRIIAHDKRAKMETRTDVLRNQLIDALQERVRRGYKTNRKESSERWAYCRDFKKEGLTKNRTLLRVMLEELHTRFPECEAFKTTWFFDSWRFELEGKEYFAKRGHGLGMANALTTLMQIIIEEMTKERVASDVRVIASFYCNDDAAIILDSEDHADRYSIIDRTLCEGLGLSFKEKSSYVARQHLNFCEQYVGVDYNLNNKTAYSYESLFILWKGINASHARELAMSLNLQGISKEMASYVVKYWGPVLYKNEYTRPRSLGGWFREISQGVDISFMEENALRQVPQMEEAANYAYQETKLIYTPWKSWKPRLTKKAQVYPQEWLLSGDRDLYIKRESTFKAESNIGENVRAWKAYEKKLKQNFSKSCSWWAKNRHRRRTFGDVYKSECDLRPKEDIIPPAYMRVETQSFEASYTADVEFEHPYRAPNQHIDLQIWKSGRQVESYPRKMGITTNLRLGSKDIPRQKHGPAQRAISLRHLRGPKKVPLKIWNLYLVPDQKTFDYWHNPFAVGRVADSWRRNYNSYIPTYLSPKKKDLLELRDQYFGRKLTWIEWMSVGTLNPADIQLLSLFRDNIDDTLGPDERMSVSFDRLIREFRKYPGFGRYLDSLEDYSPETIINGFAKWVEVHEYLRLRNIRERKEAIQANQTLEERNAQQLYEAQFEEFWDDGYVPADQKKIETFYEERWTDDPMGYRDNVPIYEDDELQPEELEADFFAEFDSKEVESDVESHLSFSYGDDDLPYEGALTAEQLEDDFFSN